MSKMIVPLTYKLMPNGVRRSDGACIPDNMDNLDWRQYQEWLADGNIPEPQYTEQELIDKTQNEEIRDIKMSLTNANVWQFRMIIELFKAAKAKGLIDNTDIDPAVLEKAQQWITKLNRLEEIDE